jgi:hypothetical protein
MAAVYAQHLIQAFRYGPKPSQVINVLMHALGYFKKSLQAKEKALFLDLLERVPDRPGAVERASRRVACLGSHASRGAVSGQQNLFSTLSAGTGDDLRFGPGPRLLSGT